MIGHRICRAYLCGTVPYETAWKWQQDLIRKKWQDPDHFDDVLLLLEHPSVYTLGRRASLNHLKFDLESTQYPTVRVDRGGDVTYHGPGQLVVYPVLDLRHYRKDLHWYLRQIEQVVIDTLHTFQIEGERINGLTGVWTNNTKIAAVGTHASKWITMHGFALNVTTDLTAFDQIIPCGITDRKVSKMQHFVPDVKMNIVQDAVIKAFSNVFGVDIVRSTQQCEMPF